MEVHLEPPQTTGIETASASLLQQLRHVQEVPKPRQEEHVGDSGDLRAQRLQQAEASFMEMDYFPDEDEYDPRKPEYVQSATADEVKQERIRLIGTQIRHLTLSLSTRQAWETGMSTELSHYQQVLQELCSEERQLVSVNFGLLRQPSTTASAAKKLELVGGQPAQNTRRCDFDCALKMAFSIPTWEVLILDWTMDCAMHKGRKRSFIDMSKFWSTQPARKCRRTTSRTSRCCGRSKFLAGSTSAVLVA